MGNDGGSIPTRRELVKEAARNPTSTEIKESLHEQQDYLWSTDPLTQRPLARPIVSDQLGRLFNKDAVIEFLLPPQDSGASRRSEQEAFVRDTIKSLKDVVELKFEVDSEGETGSSLEKWVCPVTRQELGPDSKAVYLVPCGHAFSATAIKEVSGETCIQCNEPYAPNDVIPILPTSETDISRLMLRVEALKEKGLTHSLKKASGSGKKRKKNGVAVEASDGQRNSIKSVAEDEEPRKDHSSSSQPPTKAFNGIKNAATASLTAKVLEEQEERNKRRKMDKNQNLDSLFSHSNGVSASKKARDTDFMTRGYAVPSKR